ncbi:sterol desaturase family protein [Skermania sp. ID1734]|uniref:sterol desaturase family protein n=1 Tax=Skermania sp. ID1734 TaxID=2597516 RepID=UPI001C8F7E33
MRARARLRADEAAITGGRRRGTDLSTVWREFWRHPSPWVIASLLVGALVARLSVGDWQLTDAIVPAAMVAGFPFFEWIVHVLILHWRPRRFAGHLIDPLLARKHREHHANPRDIPLTFIPWQALLWIIPVVLTVGFLAFPRPGLALTYILGVAVLGMIYEWSHYLIHTDYKPKGRLYKIIWRNHRLHHYKNEHFWFSITTAGTADRVLRTYPDPATVPTSPTAKNLHALGNR